MVAKLSFFGFLPNPVGIANPGDAVDVQIAPIQDSQGGITVPQSELRLMLNNLKAASAQWDALTLHLFLDTLHPTNETPLADFTAAAATFTGSTPQLIVWQAAQNHGSDDASLPMASQQYLATAVPTAETVSGFYVTSG